MILGLSNRPLAALVLGSFLLAPRLAAAQIILPGALPPNAAQTNTSSPSPSAKPIASRAKVSAVALTLPTEGSVIGRPLFRNGLHGEIEFDRQPANEREHPMRLSKLTLEGELVSKPGEMCRVSVVPDSPVAANAIGRPQGVSRFALALEACPFSFDLLDGAILVPPLPNQCTFTQADCRVDPSGLWGPAGSSLGPDRVRDIERSRARAEGALRSNFKALLARTHDNQQIKLIAGEQAGFSSEREQICRDYWGEDKHGFCAARITEARAASLARRLIGAASEPETTPKGKIHIIHKVGPTPAPTTDLSSKP
jgi:hypothetical protein